MERLVVADGVLDLERGEILRGEHHGRLTPTERQLLAYLAARAGRDVSRDELHARVWDHGAQVVSRAADFAVHRVRRKIELDPEQPRHLVTVAGGYRWVPVAAATPAEDRVVLLVGEPAQPGDGEWLQACARVAREAEVQLVELSPGRVVLAHDEEPALVKVANTLVDAAPMRVGLATGPAVYLVDPLSGRTLYGGEVLGLASRLARTAAPGAVPAGAQVVADGIDSVLPGSLELTSGPLFGRDAVVDAVEAQVRECTGAVVLVGTAGAGKSRVAEAAAHRWGRPAWRALLDEVHDAQEAEQVISRAVGLDDGVPSARRIGAAVAPHGDAVLVLDGAERVVEHLGPLLQSVGAEAPGLRIIVTSRRSLPGGHWPELEVSGLDPDAGMALLQARCPELPPSQALRSLVAALDGNPLALNVVAPRLRVASAADLLDRIEELLRRLVSTQHASRPSAPLHEALAASWEPLDPHERRTLVRCTAFADTFSLHDAEAVLTTDQPTAPWFVDTLWSLQDRRLLEVDPRTRRVRLFAAVRAFATAEAERDPGLLGDAVRRHAERFASLSDQVPAYGRPPFGTETGRDLFRATQTVVDNGWTELATRAGIALGVVTLLGGHPPSVSDLLDAVVAMEGLPWEAAADLLTVRCRLRFREARYAEAAGLAREAAAEALSRGNSRRRIKALHLAATALRHLGDFDGAAALLGQVEAELDSPETRDGPQLNEVRHTRAALLTEAGRFAEALATATRMGVHPDHPQQSVARDEILGTIGVLRGDLKAGRRHLEAAIAAERDAADTFSAANLQLALGLVQASEGDLGGALYTVGQTLQPLTDAGAPVHLVCARTHLAWFSLLVGDRDAATQHLDAVGAEAATLCNPRVRGSWCAVRCEERALRQDRSGSAAAGAEAAELLAGADRLMTAHTHVHRGEAATILGRPDEAHRWLAEAEAAARALEVLPTSLLQAEVRRLRRDLARDRR